MPIRLYKPTSAGQRRSSVQDFSDVTTAKPAKALLRMKMRTGGRDQRGHISVRHHGGGARQYIRVIDWKQQRYDVPATVQTIEYDPNRGARIALVEYPDKERRYVLATNGLAVGDVLLSSLQRIEVKNGNRLPLALMPIGSFVHSVELKPQQGAAMVRGAGNVAQLMAVEGAYAQLRLPSGEMRLVQKGCSATVGTVSNPDWRLVRWGKAGRSRFRGIRPTVRGKVMNPVDHPHGGGEGRNPIGLKRPKTLWGKPALGVKTRNVRKWSSNLIVQRRKKK